MPHHGYKIRNQRGIHFITFSVVQWIDVFTRREYTEILIDNLKYCQKNKGLKIYAWCIMPNHVHLLISASGNSTLSDILRDLKKFSSVSITRAIQANEKESRKNWMMWILKKAGEWNYRNEKTQFWQQDNHPVEITDQEMFEQRLNYIHNNPVKSGLVFYPEGYRYSSAIDYTPDNKQKGLLDITFI